MEGLGRAFSRNNSNTTVCLDDAPITTLSGDDGDGIRDDDVSIMAAAMPVQKQQRVVYQDPEQKDEQLRLRRLLEGQKSLKDKEPELEQEPEKTSEEPVEEDWEVMVVDGPRPRAQDAQRAKGDGAEDRVREKSPAKKKRPPKPCPPPQPCRPPWRPMARQDRLS